MVSFERNSKSNEMITEEIFLKKALLEPRKWEYHQGKLVDLEDASPTHHHLQQNLENLLPHFKNRETPNLLFVPLADAYTYPDLMLAAPTPILYEAPQQATSLLNPTVIIEIYSPTTKLRDTQHKWEFYQNVAGLEQYILVDEQRPLLQMFTKHAQGWKLEVFKDSEKRALIGEQEITLESIYK